MRAYLLVGGAALGLVACTQDYGAFSFDGQGGAGATTSTGTLSTTSTSTGSNTTSSSSGQGGDPSTTSSTTTTTTTTTTTSSSSSSSSGGGGAPPTPSVACEVNGCDIEGTQRCCIDTDTDTGTCAADGECGGDLPVECDGPEDCDGGDVCCLDTNGANLNFITCDNDCNGETIVCDPDAATPCPSGTCQQDGRLPTGYFTCQ